MSLAASEIVQAVLEGAGMRQAASADVADLVLINTCAVRENAETKVHTFHQLPENNQIVDISFRIYS